MSTGSENGESTVSRACKRCKSKTVTGCKCLICASVYHNSCAKYYTNIKYINEEFIVCCDISKQLTFSDVLESSEQKLDFKVLMYIIQQNESIIQGKDIIIQELRDKIALLNEKLERTEKTVYSKDFRKCEESNLADHMSSVDEQLMIHENKNSKEFPELKSKKNNVLPKTKIQLDSHKKNAKLFSETIKQNQCKELCGQQDDANRNKINPSQLITNIGDTSSTSNNIMQERDANENNKWLEVVNKRRRNKTIVNGINTHAKLRVIAKSKALFVTRLDPETNNTDVENFIRENNNISAKVTKLKTKHHSYASFHVEVSENDFEALFTSEIWPEGSLISEFFGKLRTEQTDVNSGEHVSSE